MKAMNTSQRAGFAASFFTIVTSILSYFHLKVPSHVRPDSDVVLILAIFCAMLAVCSSVICLVSGVFDYFRNRKHSN
jgi:hypothetical protein